MSWRPSTWVEAPENGTTDDEKLAAIVALVHEELEIWPGEEAMRILRKLLDILTERD